MSLLTLHRPLAKRDGLRGRLSSPYREVKTRMRIVYGCETDVKRRPRWLKGILNFPPTLYRGRRGDIPWLRRHASQLVFARRFRFTSLEESPVRYDHGKQRLPLSRRTQAHPASLHVGAMCLHHHLGAFRRRITLLLIPRENCVVLPKNRV